MLHHARLRLGAPVLLAAVLGAVALPSQPSEPAAPVAQEPDLPAYRLVAGESIARQPWIAPVRGYELTGRFADGGGYWSSGSHTGLDFATATGSPIRSVANGEVVSTGYDGAYGHKTVVRLPDGTEVWYCHQDTWSVDPGERVDRGEVIGTVGATGNVTGPHLHLEIRPGGGDPVDPEASLQGHRVEL